LRGIFKHANPSAQIKVEEWKTLIHIHAR
jgi:hypothetical protein